MTRLITDEQFRRLHDVLDDITGLIECNCPEPGCDGSCTYSMAEALLRDLAPWPARVQPLTGQRFRTLIEDREEDDDYGEVIHPIGSTFVVGEPLHVEKCEPASHGQKGHTCGQMYAVLWEQAVCVAIGETCAPELCKGMWTIWSTYEIGKYATAVAVQEAATGPQEPQEAAAPEPIDNDVTGCTCVDRHDGNCAYATGPQEAAAAPVPRYTVNLHVISLYDGERMHRLYRGDDETVMYSHVNAVEWTLAMTHGTAEIEIVEDGLERWIDYSDGRRSDFLQEGK